MSIYPEILKRVIANNLNTTFSTKPTHPDFIFESQIEISSDMYDWMTLFTATQGLQYDEPIVYIIIMLYLQKTKKTFSNETPDIIARCSTKFRILHELYENHLLTDKIRRNILSILQKTQRTYHAFSILSRVYRHKHTHVQINTDLYMNDLSPAHKNTFVLLDHDKIYYFSLNDLAKLILDSLTYSYLLFHEPKLCKNPYNNMPFTKSTLYNIYFQMKESFCVVPRLIQLFFEADFNVFLFKKINESVILEYIIREHVTKTEPIRMRDDILKMVNEYDDKCILDIHPLFPAKSLLDGLKPMYILYLCRKYTADGKIYENYGHELLFRMYTFIKHNPRFGRMNYVTKPSSYTLPIPTPVIYPVGSQIPFVFGQLIYETPSVVSMGILHPEQNPVEHIPLLNISTTQPTNTGNLFYHSNVVSTLCYQDAVAYNRPPNIVQNFLENHQYNEPAYNRYVYYGSIYSNDEPQISLQSVPIHDTDNYIPDPFNHSHNDSDNDSGLRVRQRHNNDTLESPEEHRVMNINGPLRDGLSSVPTLMLPITRDTTSTPVNITNIVNGYESDNDNESTETDEQRVSRMHLEYEFIIAGDISSDALSIATSIDTDVDYDDNMCEETWGDT